MREKLEDQVHKYSSEVEDLKLKLSEETDRVVFLESERTCHVEVGFTFFLKQFLTQFYNSVWQFLTLFYFSIVFLVKLKVCSLLRCFYSHYNLNNLILLNF